MQKIANLAGTGEDNVSYKKAIEKINKKQVEEIGTGRTQGRPINIVKEKKYKLQDEIGELEEFKDKQYSIENEKNEIEDELKKLEGSLEIIKELKQIEEKERIEKQKIELNKDIIKNNNEKIEKLKKEKERVRIDLLKDNQKNTENKGIKGKNNYNNIKYALLTLLIVLSCILGVILRENKLALVISIIVFLFSLIGLIISALRYNKKASLIEKKMVEEVINSNIYNQETQNQISQIDAQIELLNKTNKEQLEEIEIQNNKLNLELEDQIKTISEKYNQDKLSTNNLDYQYESIKESINNNKLKLHSLELDKNNILPKLEKLSSMEEELQKLNKKEEILNYNNQAIELAKEVMEIAYKKMKENVTPIFTDNLSKNIEQISSGRYKKVRINDEEGILVEKENGEYISSKMLSSGTIDQLYLSLRFGAIRELSKETMPIVLDETFAYYDDERLENILKYINEEFKENQVLVFTCSEREKQILDKNSIDYNYILLQN